MHSAKLALPSAKRSAKKSARQDKCLPSAKRSAKKSTRQIFFPNNGGDLPSNFAERLQQNTRQNIFYLIFAERQHQNTRQNIFLKFPEPNFTVCLLQNTRQFFSEKSCSNYLPSARKAGARQSIFCRVSGLGTWQKFFLILNPNFFAVPCVSILSFTEFGEILTLFVIFG